MQSQIAADRKTKSLAILTEVQKSEFEKLPGETFDTRTIRPTYHSFNRRDRIDRPSAAAAR